MADSTTLGALLERAADSDRGVRFLDRRETGRFLPYAELRDRAASTAAGLRTRGVAPGDRVALILPTVPEFYDAFFGAILAGAVPVPLYPPVRLARLEEYRARTAALLRSCHTRLVLGDARTARAIGRTVRDAAPELGFALVPDVRERLGPAGREQSVALALDADPDEVALIQHSSGTTGAPRPVRLSHAAIVANVEVIRRRILDAYPESEVDHATVSWLPLYHDMGLIGCVLTSLAHPVDLILLPPELFVSRPGAWLRAISRYGGTVSGAPNFAYAYCAERIPDAEREGLDLSGWHIALSGAEPVTPAALSAFADRFAPAGFRREALTPVYGLAEATLAVTFSDPREHWRSRTFDREALLRDGAARPPLGVADGDGCVADGPASGLEIVSVGRPLDGVRLRITGREGPVEEGRLGRVEVAGPSMYDGYDDDQGEEGGDAGGAGRDVGDGGGPWFDTGDTGFLQDGELYLFGRTKDVIILRGRKYAPAFVEAALTRIPGVRTGCVAAVGVPADGGGEETLAVLAERDRSAPASADGALAAAIRGHVSGETGLVAGIVEILEPGSLPRTSSGKIRRAEARRRYLDGGLGAPDAPGAVGLAAEVVRSRLALARLARAGAGESGTGRESERQPGSESESEPESAPEAG